VHPLVARPPLLLSKTQVNITGIVQRGESLLSLGLSLGFHRQDRPRVVAWLCGCAFGGGGEAIETSAEF